MTTIKTSLTYIKKLEKCCDIQNEVIQIFISSGFDVKKIDRKKVMILKKKFDKLRAKTLH